MSELTKDEVAGWIRNLVPYLEKPAIFTSEGVFKNEEYEIKAGRIIEYGDNLTPNNLLHILEQTENLKALVELYKGLN